MPSFTSTVFCAAVLATAIASPTPQTTNPVPNGGKGGLKSQCVSKGADQHTEWGIYVVNTTMPSDQGNGAWGGGLIDNLRGQDNCDPQQWQAQVDANNPQGVGATFNTDSRCQVDQVSKAINAASSENDQNVIGTTGQWVYCEGDTLNDLYSSEGQVISGIEGALGSVAGLLTAFSGAAAEAPKN